MGYGLRTWIGRDEVGFWLWRSCRCTLLPARLVRFSTTVLLLQQIPRVSQSPAIPAWHSRRRIPCERLTIFAYLPRNLLLGSVFFAWPWRSNFKFHRIGPRRCNERAVAQFFFIQEATVVASKRRIFSVVSGTPFRRYTSFVLLHLLVP